ncbi:adenylyltransferase/cytidyltransferase family protein [Campylobacter sp. VicNov18]|uniref:adenylyltransferase/cytidyltransferase family protein n=1 Tax=Campylobacter bilis TaxID=2691918 RepID=UPI001E53923D|nr:adenylyltransferase/cytidyltransferase family protein [Campylobacter bilis]MCC8278401.1 adenylyltransferase/cytidyltransferase family protein [Campylobacter bilis]MCC8299905.1 adenylyltransferase/cytidyltransferase family protein [Campylobacter bilis]MCC8301310.1 adenylyltransferase/cytidyltransferase family protein [Campylobacter bilis]MCC8350473.1 adenylyltransferase/cytidyltransferase family protein [Campylobacter bilis]MCC8356087.1 adenylyltransferase/cytidyltransferase family protein [
MITFGTFDLFHYGHLRILQRAASLGDRLIVGVSSDSLNFSKKQRYPIYSEKERLDIIASLKCVSCVFLEETLELKREYLLKYQANILVMGDDWKGKFDCFSDICNVVYFKRTPSISTTDIIERIKI